MSYADKAFKNMCRDILDNGWTTEGKGIDVRPYWGDTNEKAHTIKKSFIVNEYDLSKEFPILTLRPVPFKKCVDELLWIWVKKSNNVNDLNSKIWDSWADETGSIGEAYGAQLRKKHKYKEGEMDQVDRVLFDLKNDPYSRRIITNLYNHEDLHLMNLYPCAYQMIFNVTDGTLNASLIQRSNDVLVANAWNVTQYAVLVHMFAQVSDLKVGKLVHFIADAHIYNRHIPQVEELLKREEYTAPTFWINPEVKNFYNFTIDDFKLINYNKGTQIKIPVAI